MEENAVEKFECELCEYTYDPEKGDPENGIMPGTPFEKLPEEWYCPACGQGKESFSRRS